MTGSRAFLFRVNEEEETRPIGTEPRLHGADFGASFDSHFEKALRARYD